MKDFILPGMVLLAIGAIVFAFVQSERKRKRNGGNDRGSSAAMNVAGVSAALSGNPSVTAITTVAAQKSDPE